MGETEDRGVPPCPFLPDRSYPDSLLATTEDALAPSQVAALTGTGRVRRTCHPSAIPLRPTAGLRSAAFSPSPPSPSGPIVCQASPALSPTQRQSGPVPGPEEEGRGFPRSEGDSSLDLELKRRESQGPVGITYAKEEN